MAECFKLVPRVSSSAPLSSITRSPHTQEPITQPLETPPHLNLHPRPDATALGFQDCVSVRQVYTGPSVMTVTLDSSTSAVQDANRANATTTLPTATPSQLFCIFSFFPSGICLDCQDNTQGHNCEECLPNFYRRHGEGSADACLPCPCSSETSSGSCHLDSSGRPVCDECKPGFSGPTCNMCADGLFKSAGACVPCDCNGNADPRSMPQICHPETGHCHRCVNHTAGAHSVRILPTQEIKTSTTEIPKSTSSVTSTPPSHLLTSSSSSTTHPSLPTLQSGTGDSSGHNSTASALTVVSWTQFNIIILAVIIVVVVLLMGFVGGVYTYREYRNRKLNAPFWTIELKEDNISFSSYHDSIPHADPNGLLEEEPCVVAANGHDDSRKYQTSH
ncbi:Multiple epidermal growth factor-like domains protein 9 [Labeo rohita]|uniref:Multiple epidermal growth factor-like domains protein 9 n=1 Tax=Labeo rohita TaxID=84645 RepID=A0ABQ8MGX7_LABRO|nr:Multiple epidermal growth factor-like domains protein 9 [Labeo rohita]